MAFNQETFAPVGAHSTDTPKVFAYKTNDSFLTVSATSYFDAKRFQLDAKDIILANTSNILHVLTVTSSGSTVAVSEQGKSANETPINSMDDFPAPVGGVITLADDIFYKVGTNIPSTPNRFILGKDTVVAGLDSSSSSLSYSGTGAMFTAVDTSNKITLLTLNCPNGKLHDITNPSSGPAVFQLINCTIDSCDVMGNLDNLLSIQYTDVAFNDVKTDGITFAGNILVFTGATQLITINNATGILYDLGTTVFASFSLDASFVTLATGAILLSGLSNSGNISENNSGTVVNVKTFGSGIPLSGITVDDIRWNFLGNDSIANSRPDGFLSLTGNSIVTTLTVNEPTLVLGTWTVERTSKFIGTIAGRLTYKGEKPLTVPIIFTSTSEAASGSNKEVNFYVYINGEQQANSKTRTRLSANDVENATIMWQETLQKDDFIELFVENTTDSVGILVEDAKSVVS